MPRALRRNRTAACRRPTAASQRRSSRGSGRMPASRTPSAATRRRSADRRRSARQPFRRRRRDHAAEAACHVGEADRARGNPSSRVANRISTATCMWCSTCQAAATSASERSVALLQTRQAPRGFPRPSTGATRAAARRRHAQAAQHQRRREERQRVDHDRERRGQQLDQRRPRCRDRSAPTTFRRA